MPSLRSPSRKRRPLVVLSSLFFVAQAIACGGDEGSNARTTPGSGGTAGASGGGSGSSGASGAAAGSSGASAGSSGASGAAGSSAGAAGAGGANTGGGGNTAGAAGSDAGGSGAGGLAGSGAGGTAAGSGAGGTAAGSAGSSGAAGSTSGGSGGGSGAAGSAGAGGAATSCAATCKAGTCVGETCCPVENVCGQSCCATGDVCSFDKCITPGSSCADSSDCAATEFCDLSLGEPVPTPTCSVGAEIPSGKCLPRPPECAPGEGGTGPITCVQSCQFVPPTIPFQPKQTYGWGEDWAADGTPTSIMMAPVVMQLDDDDCDGKVTERDIPDVVFTTFANGAYNNPGVLHAVTVKDGKLADKWSVAGSVVAGKSIAAGNFDGKPGNEIVGCTRTGAGTPAAPYIYGLAAYEGATGKLLWNNPNVGTSVNACVMPYIADLDQDGKPEIIIEAGIFRGADGTKKAAFSPATNGRLAVSDLDGDGLLDIVDAFRAYRGDGTVFATVPAGSIPTGDSYLGPAIADLDGDGRPEVITPVFNNHKVAIWHLNATTGEAELARPLLEINDKFPEPFCVSGGVSRPRGGGPVTAGDFDNDGLPDIALAGGVGYVVFSGKKAMDPAIASVDALLWAKKTQDCSSAQTGSSLFDFDGDGRAEVVYADEVQLHVYDGETGDDLFNTCSTNGTLFEYPLVADIDRDGHADLLLVSNSYNTSFTCGDTPATKRSGLRVFSDPRWVRTRGVWNEHGYHVTNVEEDGTIPAIEPANWKDKRLNNYRQNKQPGQEFSAPDVVVSLTYPKCQGEFGLTARITNVGEASVPAGVVVGFYEGEPSSGTKLGSAVTKSSLYPAQSENVTLPLPNPSDALTNGQSKFYVVVDDTSDPHPSWTECRTDNNTSTASLGSCGKD